MGYCMNKINVSIHSLTQRETIPERTSMALFIGFNPLPHAEGDVSSGSESISYTAFQSTPSRRGRPRLPSNAHKPAEFQSTPSRRGRPFAGVCFGSDLSVFQSTPSRRGRLYTFKTFCHLNRFQSTPSRRGRLISVTVDFCQQMFQSTPSRRGRLFKKMCSHNYVVVSIHSLTQRETFC